MNIVPRDYNNLRGAPSRVERSFEICILVYGEDALLYKFFSFAFSLAHLQRSVFSLSYRCSFERLLKKGGRQVQDKNNEKNTTVSNLIWFHESIRTFVHIFYEHTMRVIRNNLKFR